jgi:hypothetical protein
VEIVPGNVTKLLAFSEVIDIVHFWCTFLASCIIARGLLEKLYVENCQKITKNQNS